MAVHSPVNSWAPPPRPDGATRATHEAKKLGDDLLRVLQQDLGVAPNERVLHLAHVLRLHDLHVDLVAGEVGLNGLAGRARRRGPCVFPPRPSASPTLPGRWS